METEGYNAERGNGGEYTPALFAECRGILSREVELLGKITAMQVLIRKAVLEREWMDFESLIDSVGLIGDEFALLDAERVRMFAVLSQEIGPIPENTGFYTLVSRLPEDERRELTSLFRTLKAETLKTRVENESLTGYLNELHIVVAGFLEAAFPDRKGRIYSRRGTQVPSDMRSMVLNQRL
ncbi:hypothetical protein FACS1894142_1690 [Spirochaetia bacterium]|nr:hypothetical protein FACS1894142_1690 [Spirochaetia bacterium]